MMARSGSWEQVDAVIYEWVPELRTGAVKGTRQGVYGCCTPHVASAAFLRQF